MKLVLLGLVMIAHISGNDYSSDDIIVAQALISLSSFQRLKRKKTDTHLAEGLRKKLHTVIPHADKKNDYLYQCTDCKIIGTDMIINRHLHQECFPNQGVSCKECPLVQKKFFNLEEMVQHNLAFHLKAKWKCFACNSSVDQHKYYGHFKKYTRDMFSKQIIGTFTYEKFKELCQGARNKSLAVNNQTQSAVPK